jgi:indolepyruvate ferredoxin oxidoreductase alpha subunit
MPAARDFIVKNSLNELSEGRHEDVGIIIQGGIYNALMRAMTELGLVDADGSCDLPLLTLNVVYPLVPDQIIDFAKEKKAVLVIEEGQPAYIEHEVASLLMRASVNVFLSGKDVLPMAGEYTSETLLDAVGKFLRQHQPALGNQLGDQAYAAEIEELRKTATKKLGAPVPPRPPGFCTGCPERPFFAALKLAEQEIGKVHYSADIGCHSFATFPPFGFGNSILGFGMSLASGAGVRSFQKRRPLAVMGDGGFWHNGLLSGVASRLLNDGDGVLVIMKNGYTSATGTQELISSPGSTAKLRAAEQSATSGDRTIEDALTGVGVQWLRTVHTYRVSEMRSTLKEAFKSTFDGLKVIVAEGECQLERQRRIKPIRAKALAAGERVQSTRFGIDEDTCTGDHSCIRLSGCPTLTVKTSTDPLKTDPVAHVTAGCVGCGLCGEVAHAATLCPSFWQADIVSHPSRYERFKATIARMFTGVPAV